MKKYNVVVVHDYGYIEGGTSNVAISSAIELSKIDSLNIIYVSAVGPVCNDLMTSRCLKVYSLTDVDNFHNPNKFVGMSRGIYNRNFVVYFRKILEALPQLPTIVHVHGWTKACSSAVFHVAGKLGLNIVVTLHDYFVACPNGGFYNYQQHKMCSLRPLSLRCATTNCDSRNVIIKWYRMLRQVIQEINVSKCDISYICISDFSYRLLKNYIKGRRVFRLSDPLSLPSQRQAVQAAGNNYYLYIGRLSVEKGIQLFCEAVTQMRLKAIVIGDGPISLEIQERYSSDIQFLGWLRHCEIKKYILQSRMLVFPSLLGETLGLTPLECQIYGVPAIVPDLCSASDYIVDGVNGLIFESGNIDSLKQCLKKSLDDSLVEKLSVNAYANFDIAHWSMKTHIDGLTNIYKKKLEEKTH